MRRVFKKIKYSGHTTATILAQAIFREGIKAVTAGANPMAIKRGIDTTVELAIEEIKKLSKPISGDMIAQVGRISANSDATIGDVIAEAMQRVGKDGVITVEESKTMITELETVTATNEHKRLSRLAKSATGMPERIYDSVHSRSQQR